MNPPGKKTISLIVPEQLKQQFREGTREEFGKIYSMFEYLLNAECSPQERLQFLEANFQIGLTLVNCMEMK